MFFLEALDKCQIGPVGKFIFEGANKNVDVFLEKLLIINIENNY